MTTRVCDKLDRHEPRIKCGYPLPCPYHTAVIDLEKDGVEIPVRIGVRGVVRVKMLADALRSRKKPNKRKKRR
jgi:hypothetical protein